MRVFAIDWATFLGFLEPWSALEPAGRMTLLDAKPRAVLARAGLHGALAKLLAGGFVTDMGDGERVRIADAFHESHKVLRALERHPLHVRSDPHALRAYLGEHFTHVERRALSSASGWDPNPDERLFSIVTSAGHVRGFLAAEDVRAWEKERLPERSDASEEREWTQSRPLVKGPQAHEDLVALIRSLASAEQPTLLRELELYGVSRERLAAALQAGLRYLLLFPVLVELQPALMLWPSVAARLNRPAAGPPSVARPTETCSVVLRLEDLTQLLVRAVEPLRVKQDGWTLFATAQRELERELYPLPDWLTRPRLFPENAPEARVRAALLLAANLGLIESRGEPGRDLAVATSAEGTEWLALPPAERLRPLLEGVRFDASREEHGERAGSRFDPLTAWRLEAELDEASREPDGETQFVFPFHAQPPRPLTDQALFGIAAGGRLAKAAIRAYASLAPGLSVSIAEFLEHHAQHGNPLLELERPRSSPFGFRIEDETEETLEQVWTEALQRVLHDYLLPYGGARAGLAAGRLTVELTSIGRYVLGLEREFALEAPPLAEKPVRVQPDFEVVFVASHPALEAAIGRFAERRGRGVGALFRITRDSILSAARTGLAADDVLATLEGASATAIPANVAHEIRGWSGRCRRVALERAELLRCPDEATAARVLSAAGAGKLERLSATVLALTEPAHKAAIVRLCRKAGIFLEERGARGRG